MKRIKTFFFMSWSLIKALVSGEAFLAFIISKRNDTMPLRYCGIPFSKEEVVLVAEILARILVYDERISRKAQSHGDSEAA